MPRVEQRPRSIKRTFSGRIWGAYLLHGFNIDLYNPRIKFFPSQFLLIIKFFQLLNQFICGLSPKMFFQISFVEDAFRSNVLTVPLQHLIYLLTIISGSYFLKRDMLFKFIPS